ncbi:hypothetical protein Zmor_023712 [Zophobas morio]|uniref:Sodium channel protein Nach n=1 Tax=Zophobas morio TaxID=2755281 RepID=A0AA38HXM6_9CUCU|nr:hypothetical protein Zmor_023712 [Zophobas morio]
MFEDDFVSVDLSFPAKDTMSEKSSEKKKSPILFEKVVYYFREYCNATSIHGFRYFGESRTVYEKIWWFIVFTICLLMCVFSIISVYRKWDQSPVIVTFATRGKPICDIPFPSITVCSESKVKYSVFDYRNAFLRKKEGEDLTEMEENYLSVLSYMCKEQRGFNYSSLTHANSDNFLDILAEVSPEFSIINCRLRAKSYPCKKLFTPIVTDEGICYTFNMLDRRELFHENVVHHKHFHDINETSEEWSIEDGYRDTADILTYPQRALLAGARYGLKFELKTENEKLDTLCRGSVEGYIILFHTPLRFPRPSQQYIRIPYNRAVSTTITPTQIMTSDAVKNYPAQKRQCYFPREKKLKYFNIYSQSHCEIECLTNFTLLSCQCVLFHMPRENSTRICTATDYYCAQTAEFRIQQIRLYNRIKKRIPESLKQHICHCMPMCSDIEYRVGSSQSVWNWTEEIESGLYAVNDTDNVNYHLSKVRAYFLSGNFIGSERNELYGPTDFLANFGGLLGLFTGFSILSLMEIIYFLSVRLICNIRLYRNWAGQI